MNAASKLIKLEETGGSLPDVALAPGKYTLSMPKQSSDDITPNQFEGDVAKREGMGVARPAVDEGPIDDGDSSPTLYASSRATAGRHLAMRDLQGKMIAHCENMGELRDGRSSTRRPT